MMSSGPSPLPAILSEPSVYILFVGGGLMLMIGGLYFAGRVLGGSGTLEAIAAVMIWLQFLRVAVQLVTLVLVLVAPVLASLVVILAAIIGLWILLHFVDQAHQFGSLGRATGALIMASIIMMLGLSMLLSFFGFSV